MLVKLKYLSQILNYSSSSSSIVLKESNILITKDGTVGKVFLLTSENLEFLKSRYSSYIVLKSSSFCPPSYLYYYFLSPHFSSWYSEIKKSFATINHLNISDLKEFPIIFSSLPIQQQKLINFLNQKCDLIQEFLSKIDLFLEKLEEYQEAFLYEIITSQKNNKIIKLKYLSKVLERKQWSLIKADEYLNDTNKSDPYYVSGIHFKNGFVNWATCYHIPYDVYLRDQKTTLKNNDILLTKDGTIGKVAIVKNLSSLAMVSTGIFVIRQKSNITYLESFFYYLFTSLYFKRWYASLILPHSTILHLSKKDLLSFPVLLCPLNVQQELCTFLDHKMTLFTKLQSHYQSLRAYFEEYQQSLLYETFQNLS